MPSVQPLCRVCRMYLSLSSTANISSLNGHSQPVVECSLWGVITVQVLAGKPLNVCVPLAMAAFTEEKCCNQIKCGRPLLRLLVHTTNTCGSAEAVL